MTEHKRSNEEEMVAAWLDEAKEAGLIFAWNEQQPTFDLIPKQTIVTEVQLKTKTKLVERHLFNPLTYTCDFSCNLTQVGEEILIGIKTFRGAELALRGEICESVNYPAKLARLYIDVKGAFTPQHAQTEAFQIKRKLVWQSYKRYITPVIPWDPKGDCLFKQTWAPEKYRWKKNRNTPELTVIGTKCRTIQQFMKGLKQEATDD